MNEHAPRAKFRSMDEGTAEDWAIIGSHFFPYAQGFRDRVLDHLKLLDGDYGGFPVDRLSIRCRRRLAPTAAARPRIMS